ncbi:ABC transporter permease [Paludibaculum fermentans]|uniref:ABC transporter permease n=1 Tax=Paludibaculum fermentans TaxID=1473598 RepID=A0A7S7SIY0_PALFE|nr:ABC transporter permease [Paludibaculum fermentans]QOY86589.1 ABC transporter permease [Paludibaculum fermentans]
MHAWAGAVESAWRDLVVGFRVLRRSPSILFSALAVLSLTMGASMALVSLSDRLLLKPLPIEHPDRLFQLVRPAAQGGLTQDSFPGSLIAQLEGATKGVGTILTVGFPNDEFVSFGSGAFLPEPARLQSLDVKGFALLGVQPALGRGFEAGDSEPGAEPVAILSHEYWQRRFGGAPDVLGTLLRRRDKIVRIVGVLPGGCPELDLGSSPDAWLPAGRGQGGRLLVVLRENTGPLQLEAALRPAWEEYLRSQPPTQTRQENARLARMRLQAVDASKGLRSDIRNRFTTPLAALTVGALLLLLTGCGNSGLLLAALHDRRRGEIAIRMALGASRWRLVRQVVVETTALPVIACLPGAMLAPLIAGMLVGLASDPDRPMRLAWQWDWRFAVMAAACCGIAAAVSAALPAWRLSGIQRQDAGHSRLSFRHRNHSGFQPAWLFIAVQAGLAVILLAGGGLLQTTWYNLERLNPGFDQQRLSIAELQWAREGSRAYTNSVYRLLLARIAELPGVARVSLSGWSYFGGNSRRAAIVPEHPQGEGATEPAEFLSVAPGFFRTMGVRLMRGRDFSPADTEAAPLAAILNESATRLYFGNGLALGHRFSIFDPKQKIEVVGIVEDTKLNGLRGPAPPLVYLPFFQSEFRGTSDMPASIEIQSLPGARLDVPELTRVIRTAAPGLAVRRVRTQRDLVERSLLRERLLAVVAVALGLCALLLAGLGLSGAIAHSVASRQKEFGIRLALGATARHLVGGGILRALAPVGMGTLAGAIAALFLARFLKSMLYGIEPANPFVLGGAALVLLAASAVAALVPLTRTLRVKPAVALRQE